MAKQDERFIKVLNEGSTWTTNREIWVDKTTGVNYLWLASGYAGGLTPLFRVRNKKETHYCYTDEERLAAIKKCGANPEVTRFKGLGEISPDEFRQFIGPDMRLDRVSLRKEDLVKDLLEFYMGKNTMERQNFIIQNLVIEDDTNLV